MHKKGVFSLRCQEDVERCQIGDGRKVLKTLFRKFFYDILHFFCRKCFIFQKNA